MRAFRMRGNMLPSLMLDTPGCWEWEDMGALFAGVFWGVLISRQHGQRRWNKRLSTSLDENNAALTGQPESLPFCFWWVQTWRWTDLDDKGRIDEVGKLLRRRKEMSRVGGRIWYASVVVLEVWNTGLVGSLAPLGRGAWRDEGAGCWEPFLDCNTQQQKMIQISESIS